MKNMAVKTLHSIGVFSMLFVSSMSVNADDTDIFLGINENENLLKPNIMFIMDDSGSMDSSEDVLTSKFDKDHTYSEVDGYNDDTIYYIYNTDQELVGVVPMDDFWCKDAIDEIDLYGYGSAQLAEMGDGNGPWDQLEFTDDAEAYFSANGDRLLSTTNYVECAEDDNEHGGPTQTYSKDRAKESGGWQSRRNGRFRWGSDRSTTYTIASKNRANWIVNPEATEQTLTRFTILRDVLADLIPTLDDVNIGLMSFRGSEGGRIRMEVRDIDQGTTREDFVSTLDGFPKKYCRGLPKDGGCNGDGNTSPSYIEGWHPDMAGSTPISETLYEAYLYYAGQDAHWSGGSSSPSVDEAFIPGTSKFKSPIADACQPNFVILLTDGVPNKDNQNNSDIRDLTDVSDCDAYDNYNGSSLGATYGECIDELAGYMAGSLIKDGEENVRYDWTDTDFSSTLDDKQIVKTYPIGFSSSVDDLGELLTGIANYAGTEAYTARDGDELRKAFEEIIANIAQTETTFVAPAVTVNTFNRLQHSDNIFYALFRPEDSTRWSGNLKKYKIHSSGAIIDSREDNEATVELENLAIDNGVFDPNSVSFWSDSADGHSISAGGLAWKLTSDRNLYTHLGTESDLTHVDNTLASSNTAITKELLGITSESDDYRTKILNWARGQDVDDEDSDLSNTDPARFIGDPMHSRPVVVTYGGTEESPDSILYFANNLGMLHAVDIDDDDGSELWAFMPEELLPNIDKFYDDTPTLDKVYGLDGPLVAWVNDEHGEAGKIDGDDHVYLYAGMRRGGSNYYVLDVTDRDKPALKYQIEGGTGDFAELAQTWSTPKLAKVRWDCPSEEDGGCGPDDYKVVMVFGGGYDVNQDSTVLDAADTTGRAIFMIDAETGSIIFSAGYDSEEDNHDFASEDMTNSFVADVTFIDLDADGFEDTIFATDILGKVWRIDFKRNPTDSNIFQSAGMIADLSESTVVGEFDYHHRFFNAPDVAFFNPSGTEAHLTISLGSGYRASPLLTDMNDNFYLFKDFNVFEIPETYDYYTSLDENFIPTGEVRRLLASDLADPSDEDPNFTYGWKLSLETEGEKALSRSITFNGNVLFTTFAPTPEGAALCGGDLGESRYYIVNSKNAAAVRDLNDNSEDGLESSDELPTEGIPAEPTVIFIAEESEITTTNDEGEEEEVTISENKAIVCIGLHCMDSDLEPVTKAFWRVNE